MVGGGVFAPSGLGALARIAAGEVRGAEKVGWWLALPGYVLITVSVVGSYWSPWIEEAFALIGIPGVLIAMAGSIVVGIGLVRRRFRPRVSGWLLIFFLPLFFVISEVVAIGAALLPYLFASGLAGRRMSRQIAEESAPSYAERPYRTDDVRPH